MVALVERTAEGVDLHKKLAAEGTPHVVTVLQRQIEARLRLVDLTPAEIKLSEESTKYRYGEV